MRKITKGTKFKFKNWKKLTKYGLIYGKDDIHTALDVRTNDLGTYVDVVYSRAKYQGNQCISDCIPYSKPIIMIMERK